MAFCLCCFSSEPPESAKGSGNRAAINGRLLDLKDKPNTFQVNLGNACCKDPAICLLNACCCFTGIPTCYWRKLALEKYGKYPDDYLCCQGYVGKCCCFTPGKMGDQGNVCCLCLESVCCPATGMSITRIYVMERKELRPDPVDYQIIAFSNCLQLIACICHVAAIFIRDLRTLADIIDCIADAVVASVTGCMAVQINEELKESTKSGGSGGGGGEKGAPAIEITDVPAPSAAAEPVTEKIERE